MDLNRDITYRGFLLNDSAIAENFTAGGDNTGIVGSVVDSADHSDVDVVQYTEKRSQGDGMEAGQPFLGARRIRLSGTLYHTNRAALFDDLHELRAALNPILAHRESPLDYGYQPLYFAVPTERTDMDEYPDGVIHQRILCMPRAFQALVQRRSHGGDDADSLAIPWQATLIAKDPGIQGAEYLDYDLVNAGASPVVGNFLNRGNFLSPLEMLIAVTSAAGTITFTGADSVFTINVPASTGSRILRFKGSEKVFTVEEDDVETPRPALVDFSGDSTWPLIGPGTTAFSVAFSSAAMHQTGSLMFFYERYA